MEAARALEEMRGLNVRERSRAENAGRYIAPSPWRSHSRCAARLTGVIYGGQTQMSQVLTSRVGREHKDRAFATRSAGERRIAKLEQPSSKAIVCRGHSSTSRYWQSTRDAPRRDGSRGSNQLMSAPAASRHYVVPVHVAVVGGLRWRCSRTRRLPITAHDAAVKSSKIPLSTKDL